MAERGSKAFGGFAVKGIITSLLFLAALCIWSQDIEPEIPDIQIPPAVLEMGPITVSDTEYGIPTESGTSLFTIDVPLPEIVTLKVSEPVIRTKIEGTEITFPELPRETALATETLFGIGTHNQILTDITLLTLSERPTVSFDFSHDFLDWFSTAREGSAYYRRIDRVGGILKTSFKTMLEGATLDAHTSFLDSAFGLQSNQNIDERINRAIGLDFSADYVYGDMFKFTGKPKVLLTAVEFKGTSYNNIYEVYSGIDLSGEIIFEYLKIGLTTDYAYRTLLQSTAESVALNLHRVSTVLLLDWQLPFDLYLSGNGGWFYNSDMNHKFPFMLDISGTPVDYFSFSLRGGFQVEEINLQDILEYHELIDYHELMDYPVSLQDNQRWFAEFDAELEIIPGLWTQAGFNVAWNSAYPYPEKVNARGLFPISQNTVVTLEPELVFGWNISKSVALNLGWWSTFFTDVPVPLVPYNLLAFDGYVNSHGNVYGIEYSLRFLLGPNRDIQLPYFDLEGFYRFTDNVKVIVKVDDLLAPLHINSPRYLWNPYLDVGIRAGLQVQMNM